MILDLHPVFYYHVCSIIATLPLFLTFDDSPFNTTRFEMSLLSVVDMHLWEFNTHLECIYSHWLVAIALSLTNLGFFSILPFWIQPRLWGGYDLNPARLGAEWSLYNSNLREHECVTKFSFKIWYLGGVSRWIQVRFGFGWDSDSLNS